MQTKILFTDLVSSLLSVANGAAVNTRAALDVFVPPIIVPNASTVWVVGCVETVKWNTSNAPENISNGAAVALKPESSGPITILAMGFDLRAGCVDVTVPEDVTPGEYTITLFGDSGNISPVFNIVAQ
ncbi:hypothetical protein C0995_011025 [Termitomyces sp. Mi166|nr:hypothetical protein C0995_011025 [Termitomyces sp. Mi166\